MLTGENITLRALETEVSTGWSKTGKKSGMQLQLWDLDSSFTFVVFLQYHLSQHPLPFGTHSRVFQMK